jgi:hypothetical protein
MLARSELPAVRMGRCVRIPRDELNRWIHESVEAEMAARAAWLAEIR